MLELQCLPSAKCSVTIINCCLVIEISQDAESFEAEVQCEIADEALIPTTPALHKNINQDEKKWNKKEIIRKAVEKNSTKDAFRKKKLISQHNLKITSMPSAL